MICFSISAPFPWGNPRAEWVLLPRRAAACRAGHPRDSPGTGKAEHAKLPGATTVPKPVARTSRERCVARRRGSPAKCSHLPWLSEMNSSAWGGVPRFQREGQFRTTDQSAQLLCGSRAPQRRFRPARECVRFEWPLPEESRAISQDENARL
jgi:hypothetical protein